MEISDFLKHMHAEKRCSQHTLVAYKYDLESIAAYALVQYNTQAIYNLTGRQVRSWMASLLEQKIGPRSVKRKLSTYKSYLSFCESNGLKIDETAKNLAAPKIPQHLPTVVSQSQIDNLFDYFTFDNSFTGKRDHLVMAMLYSTGMRLSELVGLKINDIDTYSSTVKVLGKRNKERIIPITPFLTHILNTYIQERKALNIDNVYLVVTDLGKMAYPVLIYRIVNKYLMATSTVNKKSPHVLRHSFATHMLNQGADLNAVKELLGHANLAATQIYTHNSIDKLKKAHQNAHPRSKRNSDI